MITPARSLASSWGVDPPLVESLLANEKPLAAWTLATGDKGDHREVKRSVDLPLKNRGLYLVVAANQATFAPSRAILTATFANITDLAIARAEEAEGLRFYAFDLNSGSPAKGVAFHLQYAEDWRAQKTTAAANTDAPGLGLFRWPAMPNTQIDALATRGPSSAWFGSPLYHARPWPEPPLVLYLTSDRPIYRPGQKLAVRVTSIARLRQGGFKIDGKRKITLELRDPNGKAVGKKSVTTDAMGAAAAEFVLPTGTLLGSFEVVATAPGIDRVRGQLPLQVEEYKRPEFEVTLQAPKGAARFGQTAQLTGQVRYYFGGAVAQVPVRFKVSRRRWLPFWAWRRGESAKVEIARGEAKTDAEGRFTVRFVAAADPEREEVDPTIPEVSDFIVEVEAHDAGGRTMAAQRSVRVGSRAVLLSAAGEHGFFSLDRGAGPRGPRRQPRRAAGGGAPVLAARAARRRQGAAGAQRATPAASVPLRRRPRQAGARHRDPRR